MKGRYKYIYTFISDYYMINLYTLKKENILGFLLMIDFEKAFDGVAWSIFAEGTRLLKLLL